MTEVVLVDENDKPIGVAEKLKAHQQALLHRAISIFIFNSKGEMLLQQRAINKYHSGGLWTNACCSHPLPGESIEKAAVRRLKEELGFETSLKKIFHFTYKTSFENGLTEYEFDHVFIGKYDGEISPNLEEVMNHLFVKLDDIKKSVLFNPERYTEWFKIALPKIEPFLLENHE